MSTDFRDRLAALAESPDAPPSALDIGRAVRDGRRRLVRTRLAGAGAVALAAVAAFAVLAGAPGSSPAPVTPGPATESPGGGTVGALAVTDPLTRRLAFGWLPPGLTASGYQDATVFAQPAAPTGASPEIGVVVQPSERASSDSVDPVDGKPLVRMAAKVAGSTEAYWWTGTPGDPGVDGGEVAILAWKIEGHGWGQLYAVHVGGIADWQHVLPRIAAGIRFVDQPVPLPFHIDGLPREFQLRHAEFLHVQPGDKASAPPWEASVTFVEGNQEVTVRAQPLRDGTPATAGQDCGESQHLSICVLTPDGFPPALTDIGGAVGLLHRITSLGTDPANWTTGVIVSAE